jgi:hypothetical protein
LSIGYDVLGFISSNLEVLSILVIIFTFIYLNLQLYRYNRQRYFTVENNIKMFDYNLLLHIVFQSIIFGGSTSVFLALLVFGFTRAFPKSYDNQIGQGAIVFAAFTFLIFSCKYVDEFIKMRINEKRTIKKSSKR